jgi:hypothetical protein
VFLYQRENSFVLIISLKVAKDRQNMSEDALIHFVVCLIISVF